MLPQDFSKFSVFPPHEITVASHFSFSAITLSPAFM
jgi:hypothetical protein